MQAYIYKELWRTLMHSYAQQGTIGNNVGRLSDIIRRVRDSLRALHLRPFGNGNGGWGSGAFGRLFLGCYRLLGAANGLARDAKLAAGLAVSALGATAARSLTYPPLAKFLHRKCRNFAVRPPDQLPIPLVLAQVHAGHVFVPLPFPGVFFVGEHPDVDHRDAQARARLRTVLTGDQDRDVGAVRVLRP